MAALLALAFFPAPVTAQAIGYGKGPGRGPLVQDAGRPAGVGQPVEFIALTRGFSLQPHTVGFVPPEVRHRLNNAWDVALRRLKDEPACRTIFARLGTTGESALAGAVYRDAGEGGDCSGKVRALTCVGCPQIRLCRSFADLDVAGAAVIVLHEALHTAGLRESPALPDALTAWQINEVVTQNCRLY